MLKKYSLLLLVLFSYTFIDGQHLISEDIWVDSVFQSLDQDAKLGQLFMVRAYSKSDNADVAKISQLITKYKIGGLCFFQGSPVKQTELVNKYQKLSKTPLLIGIDGEWGVGMRFPESAFSFPKQIMLGAIQNNNLIYEMGREIANQCKRIGVNVNFAPVVDVNNNPSNPVINNRSFGEDKYNVTAKAYAYMQGMQENGVLACAKHFPGHGDTDVDSHVGLPVINHDLSRLYEVELYPFRSLASQGMASMMVAHLHIPALDDRPLRPTTLSRRTVTDLLRNEFGYDGLIFTDALDMKGVSANFKNGEADAEALLAGNDVLLLSESVEKGIAKIKSYLMDEKISQNQLDESVKRILRSKYRSGLPQYLELTPKGTIEDINSNKALALKSELIENAITLVSDVENIVPLGSVTKKKMMSIAIGSSSKNMFQKRLDSYGKFDHINLTSEINADKKRILLKDALKYDYIIIGIHSMSNSASKNYGLSKSAVEFVKQMNTKTKVILCVFGNPYSLKNFDEMKTVVLSYEDDEMVQDITAQSIFGVNAINGRLPVGVTEKYYLNHGISRSSLGKLGYAIPERTGLNSIKLDSIDVIVSQIIKSKAAPGCQVLVAKDGKIVFRKSYGNFTYASNSHKVSNSDIYDVASLTKILATTIAIMKLNDEEKVDLFTPISHYLPQLDTTNKANLILYDMMAHHAGLRAWIPFYENTLVKQGKKKVPSKEYYRSTLSPQFSIPVAQKLFLRTDYLDTIWNTIYSSELRSNTNYRYSDLAFYLAMKIVESVSNDEFEHYLNEQFYHPLGLTRTGFNPLRRFPLSEIAPTEQDSYWRNQSVDGTVHDMGSAMLGGVGGHAGLFSNSVDVATIMQMILNGGNYGGERYFSPDIVRYFTMRHNRSTRRAIGFDMKELDQTKSKPTCNEATSDTYGHTGFTGTCAFVDPKYDLVYVFLSNRTFPSMTNNTLNKKDYREKIQSCIYHAMEALPQ